MTQDVSISREFTFICRLPAGLHARPASHLAQAANEFAFDCTLTNLRNGVVANLKSVLAMIAADVRQGDECSVRVSGDDEELGRAELRRFIEHDLPAFDEPLTEIVADGRSAVLPRSLRRAGVSCHVGLAVSRGVGQGKVVLVGGMVLPRELMVEKPQDSRQEQEQVERAFAAVRTRILAMLARHGSSAEQAVLKAHLTILGDVSLAERVAERIAAGRSAGQAVMEAGEYFIDVLRRSQSLYIRERVADVHDICQRLLEEIHGTEFQAVAVKLSGPSVVVAETLTPQQFLALDRSFLKGLVLQNAGTTSHTVILARSLGIPTVVGVKDATLLLVLGQEVVVDGERGLIVTQWTGAVRRFYDRECDMLRRREGLLTRHTRAPAITSDGHRLEVAANVSSEQELDPAFDKGANAIGLFRTEMLFASGEQALSEEEQFHVYRHAARAAGGRPVIIRTFDVGGDKPLSYLDPPQDAHSFLGSRGVRMYPQHSEMLRTQLRAILRASAHGRVQIMVPMVSSLAELLWVKEQVVQVQDALRAQNIDFDRGIPIGIMVEVPAAAFILDQLCKEADFFSIGTNDLSHYFFAVERDRAGAPSFAAVRHPSFLRFLHRIVDEVHKGGKWVGMCGEMAADVNHLPLLLGLGLDEISVPASEIASLKEGTSRLSRADCAALLKEALGCRQAEEVDALLLRQPPRALSQPMLDEKLVMLHSRSESKDEAIQEIVDALYMAGRTDDRQRVEDAVWAREEVYSTGLGHGFAIPHCKTDAVKADSIGIARMHDSIEWGSLDGQPVRFVILLAIRESNQNGKHMQVLSKLARKLMNEQFRDELLRAQDGNSMLAHLAEELEVDA